MRPYRTGLSPRASSLWLYQCTATARPSPRFPSLLTGRRYASEQSSARRYTNNTAKWQQYEDKRRTLSFRNPLNYQDIARHTKIRTKSTNRRLMLYGMGLALCLAAQYVLTSSSDPNTSSTPSVFTDRLDAPPGKPVGEFMGKVVLQKPGMPEAKIDEDGRELAETGHSVVPYFPKTVSLPGPAGDEEYHLLGLGVRTVSFLSISVYVVGMYVRAADLPTLQSAFVKHVNPLGTSLIPQEKATLKTDLLDGAKGLEIWDKVLREAGVRSAVRIAPVRNTDFAHLRDGFVRGVTQRTQDLMKQGSHDYDDEQFGQAVQDFKALFGGRGKAPKGSVLTMLRNERGILSIVYQNAERGQRENLGTLSDERVARQVWLGYLGGKSVSSEPARKNIVDGVLDLVERPVGTVGVQVT